MDQGLKRNLTTRTTWLRALYMLLFAVVFYLVEIVLAVVAVVQFLFKLFAGRTVSRLDSFGARLAAYTQGVVAFLTYATEKMPFPFSAWPDAEPDRPAPPPPADEGETGEAGEPAPPGPGTSPPAP